MRENRIITLTSDLKFQDFIDPFAIDEILDNRSFISGLWQDKAKLKNFQSSIEKIVFPIDISKYNFMVLTDVLPDTHIKKHSHKDDPIFRYVLDGEFSLNGVDYKKGDWVIVPINFPYEIITEKGYKAMCIYCMSCEAPH